MRLRLAFLLSLASALVFCAASASAQFDSLNQAPNASGGNFGGGGGFGGGGFGGSVGGMAPSAPPVQTKAPDATPIPAAKRILKQRSETYREIEAALEQKVSVQFRANPLSEVLDFLGEQVGTEIHIDEPSMEAEAIDASSIDVTLTLKDRPLGKLLAVLLDPLGLDFVIHHDVLTVTTVVAAEDLQLYGETIAYDVEDLVRHVTQATQTSFGYTLPAGSWDASELIETLQSETSGPWLEVDGDGGTISQLKGLIVVRQTYKIHREIQDIFGQIEVAQMRKAESQASDATESLDSPENTEAGESFVPAEGETAGDAVEEAVE